MVQPAAMPNNVNAVHLPVNMSINTANEHFNSATTTVQPADHKFNLVIYSISECTSGTNQPDRVKHDKDKSVSLLSKIDQGINSNSVRDCLRLGSYKKDLVQFC